MCRFPDQIQLKAPKPTTWSDRANWFVENLVLFRWQSYKNYPRLNFLLFKATATVVASFFYISVLAGGLFYVFAPIFGVDHFVQMGHWGRAVIDHLPGVVTGFLGALSLVYWKTAELTHKKWEYCCNLYNHAIVADGKNHDLLVNALAIDLLIVDLWAHRSFRELFSEELQSAMLDGINDDLEKSELASRVTSGKLDENQAMHYLLAKQQKLLSTQEKDSAKVRPFSRKGKKHSNSFAV